MSLTKTGIWDGEIVEPFLTLSDGSNWQLLLLHYVDNGNNLFTRENAINCDNFGLYSRLKWIDDFTYDNKYQFYVIQDGVQHRWTQTSIPTASSSAEGMTIILGNPVNGIAKATNQSQSYFGYNAWWGACGCWTKYSSEGKSGIQGFGPHGADGICSQYLILYARIDSPKLFLQKNGVKNRVSFYEF